MSPACGDTGVCPRLAKVSVEEAPIDKENEMTFNYSNCYPVVCSVFFQKHARYV